MGSIYCITCHGVLSYDIGICRKCPIPNDRMLDEARIVMHRSAHGSELGNFTDELFDGAPLPSCDAFMQANLRRFEEAQAQSQSDKRRDDNITWDLFNKTSDYIFGLDFKKVPEQYKRYIKTTYGH